MSGRHEIPTHLSVPDRAWGGLTMRQLLTLAVGLALAYGVAGDLPLAGVVRLPLAALVVAATALLVLWRPAGRPAEDWLVVLLGFWAAPHLAVWRPLPQTDWPVVRREVLLPPVPAGPAGADLAGSDLAGSDLAGAWPSGAEGRHAVRR